MISPAAAERVQQGLSSTQAGTSALEDETQPERQPEGGMVVLARWSVSVGHSLDLRAEGAAALRLQEPIADPVTGTLCCMLRQLQARPRGIIEP
eukprot:949040-Rhodomonas_salina.2